jgi:t-SNARE complex subunit (syntaxin)
MKSEQLIEKKESSNNIMKQKQVNDFRVSLIEVKEISSMESIQREREEELQKIHKVTGQIVDMTGMMKTEINKQGDLLDNIEDHVVDAKVNVIGADKEIKEADKIMKSTTKKIVCLVIAIIIIIAIILVLVFTVFV